MYLSENSRSEKDLAYASVVSMLHFKEILAESDYNKKLDTYKGFVYRSYFGLRDRLIDGYNYLYPRSLRCPKAPYFKERTDNTADLYLSYARVVRYSSETGAYNSYSVIGFFKKINKPSEKFLIGDFSGQTMNLNQAWPSRWTTLTKSKDCEGGRMPASETTYFKGVRYTHNSKANMLFFDGHVGTFTAEFAANTFNFKYWVQDSD